VFGACFAAIAILALAIGLPRILAVYELYWSKDNIQRLFYEELGLSEAWSSFIAIVGSFFYGLAWVPLTAWTFRVLIWRFNTRQLATAFGCWVLVYGHVPLLEALLGSDNCFNQRTGVALKWYVEDPNGQVTLFDSAGFDTVTRAEKQPVTPDVCRAFALQKNKEQPRRITAGLKDVEFFDPNNGRAKVWYSKAADGSFALYDRSGFDPVTSDPLHPVTKDIVAGLMTADLDRQRVETAATEAQAREAAKQREQERQRAAEIGRQQADAEKVRIEQEETAGKAEADQLKPTCPGLKQTVLFGYTPIRINPNAQCAPDLWFDGHCINVQRARWTNDTTVYHNCGGPLPNDVEFAWSAGAPFEGAVELSPPRYRQQDSHCTLPNTVFVSSLQRCIVKLDP
jgi:hypothetical protein